MFECPAPHCADLASTTKTDLPRGELLLGSPGSSFRQMSGADQVAPIWSRAIRQYETITKKRLDDPTLKEVTTVSSMLELVEKENISFNDFRSKGEQFRTALKYALLPVELVGDLAASGAAMAFPPSSLIFAGVSYLIQAANGVSEKYDAILEMMSTLKV